jgi:hypothetical protein
LVVLAAVPSATTAACGGDGDGSGVTGATVANQPLSGMINNQPWTFVSGQTDPSFQLQPDLYSATLFDKQITSTCTDLEPPDADRQLLLNIPKAVGTYTLSIDLNQTFSYTDAQGTPQNDVATSGVLEVTSLTNTTLRGGVRMHFRTADSVEGQFEITVCNM